jgi:phosphoglycolate phosphatase-like HAD superfamily hydrolase
MMNLDRKEVFWDFDGTLYDSYPAVIAAVQDVFRAHHFHISDEEIRIRMMTTMSSALQAIIRENHLGCTLADFDAGFQRIDPSSFPLYPYAAEALASIVQRGGHNYLLTHRNHTAIEALRHSGLEHLFTEMITSESGYPRKPNPLAVTETMKRHAIQPENALVIGDRQLEIELARNAGIQVIWFASSPVVPAIPPDAVIHSLQELLP